MTNSFLSGPSPSIESPGPAPYSGVHYDPKNGSILEQFPPEILDKILINLQPIWLFQLELAVPNIALYLTHPASNPVWVCTAWSVTTHISMFPILIPAIAALTVDSTKLFPQRFFAPQSASRTRTSTC